MKVSSSGFRNECPGIGKVLRVDVQYVLPCIQNPLGRYRYEPEDKSLYAARPLESESLGIKPAHDVLLEIVYQGSKQKKGRVLSHERLWESVSSGVIIHVVKDTLLAPSQILEFNDGSC